MSHPSRVHRTRIAVAVLAATTLVHNGAAQAETVTVHDPVGDVESVYLDENMSPAPRYAASDITRTVASYRMARLKITVHLRDLRNASALETYVIIRTPRARFFASVVRGPRNVRSVFGRPRTGEVECERFTGTYERGEDRVTLVVPAACIDSPQWVQVGVRATGTELKDIGTTDFPLQLDDAGREGAVEKNIRLGPRIGRG